jgi:predicted acylesterase/phospholipase RssA
VRQAIKSSDILIYNLAMAQLKDESAIIIRPRMEDIQFNEFGKGREAVRAGERAAIEMMPRLRLAVEGRSPD